MSQFAAAKRETIFWYAERAKEPGWRDYVADQVARLVSADLYLWGDLERAIRKRCPGFVAVRRESPSEKGKVYTIPRGYAPMRALPQEKGRK